MNAPPNAPAPPAPLPGEIRAAAIVAAVLTSMVGFVAAQEGWIVLNGLSQLGAELPAGPVDERLMQTLITTQREVLEGMRGPRATVLLLLSLVCGFGFVAAVRLLWPAGLPREPLRRMAAASTLLAGILRTVDGAMQLVIANRLAQAITRLEGPLANLPPEHDQVMRTLMKGALVGSAILSTLFMAGGLVAVSQYLRSERAKQRIPA